MKPVTDTDTDKKPMQAEQAADFAALQASANGAPPAPGVEPEKEGPDLAAEITGLVTVAVATLGPLFPSLRDIYTPEITEAAAGAIAAVCDKHGWLAGGMMGKWGEEIACLAIVGPLAYSTYKGISGDMEASEQARKPPKAMAAPAGANLDATASTTGGVGAVTFGEVVPA